MTTTCPWWRGEVVIRRARRNGERCESVLHNEPTNSVLQHGHIGVHDESDFQAAQAEVGEHLSIMNRHESLRRFDFNDELTLDYDIHTIAALQSDVFVENRQWHLPLILDATLPKLEAQAFLVDGFEKSRTELSVDLNS